MKSKRSIRNRRKGTKVRWRLVLLVMVLAGAMALLMRHRLGAPQIARNIPSEQSVPGRQGPGDPAPGVPPASKVREAEFVELVNRANQLLAQGEPEPAAGLLKEAAKLSPDDEDVFYNLGIALTRLGKQEEAIEAYQEALRLFPEYAEVHNNLGNLFLRMGKAGDAIRHLEQAVQITPDYAAAWNNLGNALQQLGRADEAQRHFEKAVELDPEYWQAHFNLGSSYLQQSRLADARRRFETVLQLQPEFPQAKAALERLSLLESGSSPAPPQP